MSKVNRKSRDKMRYTKEQQREYRLSENYQKYADRRPRELLKKMRKIRKQKITKVKSLGLL